MSDIIMMYNPDNAPDFSKPWLFSDVVFAVEERKFHVHKSTLSMWSPVFEKMFTSDFSEKGAREIPLPGKYADEIEVLLKLVYTHGKNPQVSDENFLFLLTLAEEYQMGKIKEFCCEFLSRNLQDTNCVKLYLTAERFSLYSLSEQSLQESKYLPLNTLESNNSFKDLPDQRKLAICKARINELEKTLEDYVICCSTLVEHVYREVANKVQTTECDNYEVHRCRVNEPFKLSCKCCRRRVQYAAHCNVEYGGFRTHLKKLFDLEHYNRVARECKNSS